MMIAFFDFLGLLGHHGAALCRVTAPKAPLTVLSIVTPDAYLGGETSGGKRGRGAARKALLVAAGQVSADGRLERLRLSPVAGFRKPALQAWAEQHLQAGTLVRSDGLGCFRGVQTDGCAHQAQAIGGGKRAAARRPG